MATEVTHQFVEWQKAHTGATMMLGAAIFLLLSYFILFAAADMYPHGSFKDCTAAGNPITESAPPTCNDGHHTFVGPIVAPTIDAGVGLSGVAFTILVEGDSGGDYPKRDETIRDGAAWNSYWTQVHAGLKTIPPILPVDFNTSDVIALSEGKQSTGGYDLRIANVAAGKDTAVVRVTESVPTIHCLVTEAITNRYYIAMVPKLPADVRFEVSTNRRDCAN